MSALALPEARALAHGAACLSAGADGAAGASPGRARRCAPRAAAKLLRSRHRRSLSRSSLVAPCTRPQRVLLVKCAALHPHCVSSVQPLGSRARA